MRTELIVIISILSIILFILLLSFILFMVVFYSKKRKPVADDYYPLPNGKIYEPHYEQIRKWIKEFRGLEHKTVSITSHDGLTLRGRYYKFYDNSPTELMLHGYRGDLEKDLSGGIERARRVGHNVLIVDQRASGKSDGHIISFGVREHIDCVRWVDFIIKEIDSDAKIILSGVSMGAATVLMASGCNLPENVIGVLADCGYNSPDKIIKEVIRKIHLPASIIYPFIALGARLFGGFSLSKYSPLKAVQKTNLPIIFFHGDNDDFVPMQMSVDNYNKCNSEKKRLVITKGAGHGLCFIVDEQEYIDEVIKFFG